MAETFDAKLFDKRVASRYIKKGLLDQKDFDKHLKGLPDLVDEAMAVEATIEPMHVGATGNHPEEE